MFCRLYLCSVCVLHPMILFYNKIVIEHAAHVILARMSSHAAARCHGHCHCHCRHATDWHCQSGSCKVDFEPGGARALPALRLRASEARAAPRPSRRRLTALAPQVALGGALSLESYGCSLRLSFKKRVSRRAHLYAIISKFAAWPKCEAVR